jgi:hypothetical protein
MTRMCSCAQTLLAFVDTLRMSLRECDFSDLPCDDISDTPSDCGEHVIHPSGTSEEE